ncbi:MAG: adenosylmethionine--8-amino-7-oxononanoate transaminase, partial [Pseudohongiellaceae bacterium]
MTSLIDYDRQHVWHPYTSMTTQLPAYQVASAEGVRLKLADGRELIDGMSSWWCAIHGYNHPALNAAISSQLEKTSHVMFGGLTHEPAVSLARRLIDMTPAPLQHVFFADSGSVSVEVAIKMAIQFWGAQGHRNKHRLLTIRGGYHGDTFGAMSVCDPVNGMHERFRPVLPDHLFVDRPEARQGESLTEGDLAQIEQALRERHDEIAAVILEPLVQGAGGMWFYATDYLTHVADLCQQYDVLLICDEIATGFGRTGKLFACDHAEVVPDILCLGKALTGGYISLAATLANRRVAEGISADGGVLLHGPTFMANPLACAAGLASIGLLLNSPWQSRVQLIESRLSEGLAAYRDHPAVRVVGAFGEIGVVQTHDPVPVADVQKVFVDAGVWIRPFADLIYLMPAYVMEPEDLGQLITAIGKGLDQL